jgi:hypothetical protein
VYRPRRKGQGIDDLRRAAVAELVPAVVDLVRATTPDGPCNCLELAYPPAGISFFVSLVDNTFEDPCSHLERSPKIGSTVEALATALGDVPDTVATKPVATTIAQHEATYVELSIPATLPCEPSSFYLWQDSPKGYWWALGGNETIRVWIVDVGDQRVVIAARSYPGTSEEATAELKGILESMVFDAAP